LSTSVTNRPAAVRLAALAVTAALVSGAVLAGCGLAKDVKKVASTVQSNKAVIDLFTAKLKSGQPAQFVVRYMTTGSAPSKISYAVQPPGRLAFSDSQTGSGAALGGARLIVNSAGAYACTLASGPGWSCDKLPKASAAAQKKLLDFYTPAHWVAFLEGLALTAGFAGDKISSSSITVNGFAMQCVDFRAPGVPGTSKICTTAQHLLGYVKVASESTGFEITSYSGSPPAALFALPAGAKVTVAKSGAS
jgi:hypothetical protein